MKLKGLLDAGVLTETEFDAEKAKLLGHEGRPHDHHRSHAGRTLGKPTRNENPKWDLCRCWC